MVTATVEEKGNAIKALIEQLGDKYLAEKTRADAETKEAETARREYTNLNRDYLALAGERDKTNAALESVRGEKSRLETLLGQKDTVIGQKEATIGQKDATIANQAKQLAMYENIFAGMEQQLQGYLAEEKKE